MLFTLALAAVAIIPRVSGHSAFWHPSMWGFNVTDKDYPYDNRPVVPIKNMNFTQWWFHGHLDHPPNDGDFFELPAGKPATAEISCTRPATSFFKSAGAVNQFTNPSDPEDPCPGSPTTTYHTNNFEDLMGCSLAIAYKSDVNAVKPEDFTVFSVNQTCVWRLHTDFQVPARMPPCPPGGCICAFFWVHSPLSGGEENYMNGFRCNVTGSTSNVPIAQSKVARRCGADPLNQRLFSTPSNCTYGAKTPFYWFNNEGNNMFEGDHSPPVYNDLYNFLDGAQDDIFIDSYLAVPEPSVNASMPIRADDSAKIPISSIAGMGLPDAPVFPTVGNSTTDPRATVGIDPPASPSVTGTVAAPTVTPSASAVVGDSGSYGYKRDMSDAHLSANAARRFQGLRVNVESRRHFERRSRFW